MVNGRSCTCYNVFRSRYCNLPRGICKNGKLKSIIQTNISNLAGVPSVVFGILGLTVFVRSFGLGNIVLAGGLTMSLLVLPIVVVASQEAIRAVPQYLREASYGMGATKWQTIKILFYRQPFQGC